jgi:GNAT superfamily N-acetyltransferase
MLPGAIDYSISAIRDLLSRSNEAPYDVAAVAEEKVFGKGYEGEPIVRVHGDYHGISVTCGKYLRLLAVDPSQRRRGIGSALLREAESGGVTVVAAEPGNYFTPGIVESDTATLAFFRKRGYRETARTQNLTGSTSVASGLQPAKPARAGSPQFVAVLEFIERVFGPIWRFESSNARTLFYVEADGVIAGFATQEANNRGLGFFGPTGVDPRFRGRGLGRDLLLASLDELRGAGFERVIIPWTDAIEFYRKSCGAEIAHKFVIMRRIAP